MIDKITQAIQQSELVQLAVIEAIHRLYYDNVGSDKETGDLGDYVACLWNMHPDWRSRMIKLLERYDTTGKPINDVPIFSKPAKIVPLAFPVTVTINRDLFEPVKFERRRAVVDNGRYIGEDRSEFIDNFHID